MANRKKPFVAFNSKEEFDKWCDEKLEKIREEGRAQGFEEGCVWVLSYIEELMQDMFKPEAFAKAHNEIKNRRIEEWRRTKDAKSIKQKMDLKELI